MRKSTTSQVDETQLAPMLNSMAQIRDLATLREKADEFLTQCRFAGDKIVAHKRKLQELTNVKQIQQLCWNVLLSGEGQKVIRA